MKSMTGFGRAELAAPFGRIVTEVQAVNRKYLEVSVSISKEYNRFENKIRKIVTDRVARGSIAVRIHILSHADSAGRGLPDLETLQNLKKTWEELAISLGYEPAVIQLPFLLQCAEGLPHLNPQLIANEEENFIPISECLLQAVQALQAMREIEGAMLAKDILARFKDIETKVNQIEKTAPQAVEKLRVKLKERMNEVLTPGVELDDRLLREVALFAERLDISEEITRFRSHSAQYDALLKSREASGRKMDFLIQEMGREINTIGSKATDAKIAHLVVEVKSELEKIREQIQNIE